MTDQEPRSYESAAERIEAIVKRLDSGEAGLRETLDLVKEGRELVEWCAGELEAVGKGLEELRLDKLVARLQAGGRAAGEQPAPLSSAPPPAAADAPARAGGRHRAP